ncbi:unnamed protein product [Miscanthus lutarioriparius]|uniref:F-box domain-containing protein n=1 Tax=Miscanthus lutarioriparius TaxID=422564 RepID=A0A811QFR1_9POAL|nr:unnamed protein product [Miscanthus lutarioriparius]
MAAESCHPRGLSWFARSCIPADPARHTAVPVPIPASAPDADVPDPETEPPIAALPDELLLEILARVPRASLPPLPAVCRRIASLLASQAFLHLRRARGRLRPCLLAVSSSSRALLLQLHASPSSCSLDIAALPLLLRWGDTKFAAAAVGARIYVAGGSARTAAVEEYDPAADAWRVVAEAPRRRYGCAGAGAGGVFYVAGGVAVGGRGASAALVEAHAWAGSVDALHVASGAWAWARPRAVPGGGCVVGACGAGDGHLYVVASHAVDLSFWRWHGGGGRGSGGGGWVALEAPPVPRGAVGLGVAVRVAMAGVGADRVAAVVNVAAVRGHAAAAAASGGAVEGLVLVYDIGGGRWSRAPDLPPGFRRAACAAVEC